MAVAHVQTPAGGASGSGTSLSVSMPSVVAGNALTVAWRHGGATGRTITCSDGTNTYTSDAIHAYDASDGSTVGWGFSVNVASGSPNVSFGISGGSTTMRMIVSEFSGVATASALDQTAGASGSSTTPASGNVTPTTDGQLILACTHDNVATTTTAGTDFTILTKVPTTSERFTAEYYVQPTAAAHDGDFTFAASRTWSVATMTLKAAVNPVTIDMWQGSAPVRMPPAPRPPQTNRSAWPILVPDVTQPVTPLSWWSPGTARPAPRRVGVVPASCTFVPVVTAAATPTDWRPTMPGPSRRPPITPAPTSSVEPIGLGLAMVSWSYPDRIPSRPSLGPGQQRLLAWNPSTPAAAPAVALDWLPVYPTLPPRARSGHAALQRSLTWDTSTPAPAVVVLDWLPVYPTLPPRARSGHAALQRSLTWDTSTPAPAVVVLDWLPVYPTLAPRARSGHAALQRSLTWDTSTPAPAAVVLDWLPIYPTLAARPRSAQAALQRALAWHPSTPAAPTVVLDWLPVSPTRWLRRTARPWSAEIVGPISLPTPEVETPPRLALDLTGTFPLDTRLIGTFGLVTPLTGSS